MHVWAGGGERRGDDSADEQAEAETLAEDMDH
jgi:hypothetical protein